MTTQPTGSQIRADPSPSPRRGVRGLLGSLALHGLLVLAILFGLPRLAKPPPELAAIIPVDLVRLGPQTGAPTTPVSAALPQQPAPETGPVEASQAVPEPASPPPQLPPNPRDTATPDRPAVAAEAKSELPRAVNGARPETRATAKPRTPPAPVDDLASRLQRLARLQQPAAAFPPSPRQQDGQGLSNLAATSDRAGVARDATYGVKDFIRAQIERHWNLDGAAPDGWVVSIRLQLEPDGKVRQVEIVDDPRLRADPAFRDFALSARNAVWRSSPLTVPAGKYDIARDLVLEFSPRRSLQ